MNQVDEFERYRSRSRKAKPEDSEFEENLWNKIAGQDRALRGLRRGD